MRLATVEQSKKIDEVSQVEYDLSAEVLMESAGALAAREIYQSFFPEISRGTVGIVCGPGNNAGDGVVVARHLHSSGERDLILFTLSNEKEQSELLTKQLNRANLQGVKVVDVSESPEKLEQLRACELIVDAIFGIGLSREITGDYLAAMDLINSVKVPVVSLDCPSGLDCDKGIVSGSVIKAHTTLSFGLAKPGFFVADGPEYVGKLRVLPIGFPLEAHRGIATSHFLFNEKLAKRYLKTRKNTTNKSDHGHLLVAAGSDGAWGAGVLSSSSAYRLGVGYVTWASHENPLDQLKQIPEVLTSNLGKESSVWKNDKITAWLVGPGLGVNEKTADLIRKMKDMNIEQAVLDADALTVCVQYNLFPLPKNWVITPHSGELSRIMKKDSKEIDADRYTAALEASKLVGCHVLLKGYRSIIAYNGRCMVINSGNSALAKAGTGDILAGMIGALLAQGLETLQASATAAYIHGRMADEWIRIGHDKNSLTASDLTEHLPQLMSRISGGSLV